MESFKKAELEEALRAITSTISKSEKVQAKLKAGTFHHTMTIQGIKAYHIAIVLIKRELETNVTENPLDSNYTKEELEEALQSLTSVISRVEQVQPKFSPGTPQHTLAVRRIKAFCIASELIIRELETLILPTQ